jgi:hypothetical protein
MSNLINLNETKQITFEDGQVLRMKCVHIDSNGERYLVNTKIRFRGHRRSPIAMGALRIKSIN